MPEQTTGQLVKRYVVKVVVGGLLVIGALVLSLSNSWIAEILNPIAIAE